MSSIYRAVKPLLYISAVFGLAPIFVDEESKTVSSSKSGISYSLVIFVLYGSISVYAAYNWFKNTSANFTYIGDYTYLVLLICGIVVAQSCLLLIIVQRKKVAAMIENFHHVTDQLIKLKIQVPYERFTRNSAIIIAILALIIISLFSHDFLITEDSLGIFFWITYFIPVIFTTIMQCQFILAGLLLRWNFVHLNEGLRNFEVEDREIINGQKKFIDDGYFEASLIRRTSDHAMNVWENDFSKFRIRKIVPTNDIITSPLSSLAKVKVIRKLHSNLCEIKELLNSSYSLQLLSTVAQAFVIITTNLYTLFTSGSSIRTHPGTATNGVVLLITFPIIWTLFRSLELICITVTCTKISKAANHTAVIVHKLLSRDWEHNVRNQFKLFSIQLLHRKISFSACGFFTLDMTLLHAIIGAATTYLVILIQFHNTYEENT